MKRRSLLGLIAATPACSLVSSTKDRVVHAGPFSFQVPAAAGKAIVEQVPMRPLFTAEARRVRTSMTAEERLISSRKPSYHHRPEHWAIRFPKLARKGKTYDVKEANDDPTAPQILIHRYPEWAEVYADGSETTRRVNQDSVAEYLHKLDTFRKSDARFPNLAYLDASFFFASSKRLLSFSGGEGIRYLGQWCCEPDILSNTGLHYLFNGFTKDGSTHVLATFPLYLPGLPDGGLESSHLGRSIKNYQDLVDNFDSYEKEARAWIEAREAPIQPSLAMLDGMIEGLTGSWA